MPTTDELAAYADVAIRIGVGLEEGDRLLVHSSIDAREFTRIVVECAYAAGASNVDVLWGDDAVARARFTHGSDAATDAVTSVNLGRLAALEAGDRMLYITAVDPDAMAGIDAQRLARFQATNMERLEPLSRAQGTLDRAWCVLAAPHPTWATGVFPDLDEEEAVEALWQAILRSCRVDRDDPVASWRDHLRELGARSRHLTEREYTSVHYRAPGTDLRLGLPEGAVWMGGNAGTGFVPNLPTEEVFTAPHRLVGDGVVTATKPLSLFGNLISGFRFEVRDGAVVSATADRGQDVLDELLATDEGSVRFGEVAMVPMSSAVAAEGLVWNNTLYDENDGCHIAIGRAYPISIEGGSTMDTEALREAGLNHSSTHVDFVVGSDQLDVVGVRPDGTEEPIITAGEWGFETS